MTHIPAIDANRAINSKAATYNAVKIQINDPRTNIPEDFKSSPEDDSTYNAVSIDVNRPSVEAGESCPDNYRSMYDYPLYESPVTSDIAPIHPVNLPTMPAIPVAYQTNNFVNNRTFVNAEFEFKNKAVRPDVQPESESELAESVDVPADEILVEEEVVEVPAPNVTTTEEQKADSTEVAFQGVNFKGEEPVETPALKAVSTEDQKPEASEVIQGVNFKANEQVRTLEIVPPIDIKPEVDVPSVIAKLSDSDFDVQAKQMEEIARISIEDSQKAVPYIVTEIFSELINIVQKDSAKLEPPTEKQMELRKQIIVNEIVKEQAKIENKAPETVELPYTMSEEDVNEAAKLSPMEQAERNKEYALYTMAILAKVYVDEVQKHTGNTVPLTDLPGVSVMVDTLREDANPSVKISAIDALRYINRPEYKEELSSLLTLASNDSNPYVARSASTALENLV